MADVRSIPRYATNRAAKISLGDGSVIQCTIRDLSTRGAKIELSSPIKTPNAFILTIQNVGIRHRCHVAWRADNFMGVYFD